MLQVKDEPDSPPVALGMVDRSRILLCFLTFLCLSFNPLTVLLRWGGAGDAEQHPYTGSGRSILSLEAGQCAGAACWGGGRHLLKGRGWSSHNRCPHPLSTGVCGLSCEVTRL